MRRPSPLVHRVLSLVTLTALLAVLGSCTQESYEPGDGKYSYLRSDFAEVATNSSGQIVTFDTDGGRKHVLKSPFAVKDLKADTVYRALVYYSEPTDSDPDIKNVRMINVCRPWPADIQRPMKTDPVGWESVWVSHNKRYINLALNIMVGVSGDEASDAKHVISVCQDTVIDRNTYYSLYHDQNGVPEYYTQKTYLSIPIGDDARPGDEFTIKIRTYDGMKIKTVYVP